MAPINKLPKKLKNNEDDILKAEELSSSSYSGSESNQGSDSKQFARVNRVVLDKNSDEYKKRRERNNLAVKKSRNKSKMRTQQTLDRVNQLKQENEMLETKIKILTKELNFLKDLFLAHAGTAHGGQLNDVDFTFLNNGNSIDNHINNHDHKVPSNDDMIKYGHIDADDDDSDAA